MLYEPIKTFTKMIPGTDTHFAVPFFNTGPGPSLLIHANGTAGSTVFPDATGRHIVTPNGAVQVDTSQSKFGNGSALCTNATDFLSLDGSADFTFGLSDFIVDLQVKIAALQNHAIFDFRPSSPSIAPALFSALGSANQLTYIVNGVTVIQSVTALTDTTVWYHIMLSRSGGNTQLFVNGIAEGGVYVDANNYVCASNGPLFGATIAGLGNNLSLDEIRVVKGVGQAANFTPPTSPYLPS